MIFQMSTPQMELWRIDGPFSNVLHSHEEEFQITVPMYGTCRFTQENRNYELAVGDGLVQHPRERHVFEIGGQAGVLIFKVKQEGWKAFVRRDSLELDLKQRFDRDYLAAEFRQWMDSLLTYDSEDGLVQEEVESRVLGYLCGTLSGNHRKAGAVPMVSGSVSFDADPYMGQAMDYIHARYKEPIRVEELARIAMQSRFHFIRNFKSSFGATPYQYVLRLRIEEAKRLLRLSNRSVTNIGTGLGFSSGSAFYRAFVKSVGVTPEQFRQR